MGAMTLLVDQRGTVLTLKQSHTVCLTYSDGERRRVGLYALRRIIIHGDVDLSTTLLRACEEAKVSLILLPRRGKGTGVNLFPYQFSYAKLRLAQYRAYLYKDVGLYLAQKVVTAKIQSQSLWLNEHHLSCDLSSSENNVQKAPDNATLMGVEGSASRQYLAQWRSLWDESWGFKERNRRPPLDPVNSLLSLSYTLAGNHIGQWATTYGLDLSSRQKFLRAKTFASNLDFCMFH